MDQFKLPSELWLEIFRSYLYENLKDISLTCTAFRELAQPLLCQTLVLKPFYRSKAGSGLPRQYPNQEQYKTLVERLHFFAQDHIAPAVEEFYIIAGRPQNNATKDDGYSRIILDLFFELVPRFTNQKLSLNFHSISFSAFHLQQLSRMPRIPTMTVQGCDAAVLADQFFLPVENLYVLNQHNPQVRSSQTVTDDATLPSMTPRCTPATLRSLYSCLINPDTLQNISLGDESKTRNVVLTIMDEILDGRQLNRVRELSFLNYAVPATKAAHNFLSLLPNVSKLVLCRGISRDLRHIAPTSLSRLSIVVSSADTVALLAPDRSIKHLMIDYFLEAPKGLEVLSCLALGGHHLDSLFVKFDAMLEGFFTQLFNQCSGLKILTVVVSASQRGHVPNRLNTLMEMLSDFSQSTLPPSLQFVQIAGNLMLMEKDRDSMAKMLVDCSSRHPHLEKIWIGENGMPGPILSHGMEYDVLSGINKTVDNSLDEHWERMQRLYKI